MRIISLIALMLLYGCSVTPEQVNNGLIVANNVALVTDWAQTQTIATSEYRERNTVMGRDPDTGNVNSYFAVSMVLYNVAAYLGKEYLHTDLNIFANSLILIKQIHTIKRNNTIGIEVNF